ncbi:MAG: VPGUxxT family thioredoxin-like (seleno)protein, type 2 [Saprospiraceae bacterium]
MKLLGAFFISTALFGLVIWEDLLQPTAKPGPLQEQPEPDNPPELGSVHWSRNLDEGLKTSAASGKPVLILFQEVPGCSNCTRYGGFTLSHPLIVEAIETYFTPVCIYNNKGGKDAQALARFNEPAWNNPVVRIIDASGKDLVPRMADFRSSAEIVRGMRTALQEAPAWMEILEEELAVRENDPIEKTYSMYCFWSGEKILGALPGVIETEAGFQHGREVVRVVFDGTQTSEQEIEKKVSPQGIKSCGNPNGFRKDHTPKYYLAQTHWKYVPMTSLQACKANVLAANHRSPESVLSERQVHMGQFIQTHPEMDWENMIGQKPLSDVWESVARKIQQG